MRSFATVAHEVISTPRLQAALARLRPVIDALPDAFAVVASRLEPVIEVLHLSGAPDYQLRVACRDTAELDRLLRHLTREGGVSETDTRVVLRSAFARGVP